jgi:hypothetical protein
MAFGQPGRNRYKWLPSPFIRISPQKGVIKIHKSHSSIAVWNFIPPVQMVAEAEEAPVDEIPANTLEQEKTEIGEPLQLAQLSKEELEQASSGPRERIDVAQVTLPNVTELIASVSTTTQAAVAAAES